MSHYTYSELRERCPCAPCTVLVSGQGGEAPFAQMVAPGLTARDIVPVGRYALHIVFSDGHDSGIFPFDLLRQHCPCAPCAQARAGHCASGEAKASPSPCSREQTGTPCAGCTGTHAVSH